jgi:hypothetical protein
LGDFTLGGEAESLFKRLNGYIRVLEYPWHHDKRWLRKQTYTTASKRPIAYEPPIVVLEDVEQVEGRGVPAILCHYAFSRWERRHYGSYHFFGHSHGKYNPGGRSLDVGVDSAYVIFGEYRPFSLEEAISIAKVNGENTDDSLLD